MRRIVDNKLTGARVVCIQVPKADNSEGHKFRTKLEGAAPHLLTFLRYPGMPPRNNGAQLEIRDTAVLHRNVRHQLSTAEGGGSSRCWSRWRASAASWASFRVPR